MTPILYAPTASGKSTLAMEWAMTRSGTIVNADALQVYDALPILTARPSGSETVQVPHELYGYADPLQPMTAAGWATDAAAVLEKPNPILVGGTGLYIKTLMEGIAPIPDSDPVIRAQVEAQYAKMGAEAFQKELARIDSVAADAIEPNNRQRLQRAMEVFIQTGVRFSEWHQAPKKRFISEDIQLRLIVFLPERDWVRARAASRVKEMMTQGVLDEVADFGQKFGTDNPAAKALGFAPLWAHVQGELSLDESIQQTVQDTNAYIKRQLTWGRTQLSDKAYQVVTTSKDAAAALNA